MQDKMTFDQLRREAAQLGCIVEKNETFLHVAKKQPPHVFRDIPIRFSLDQERASDYALLQAYYWIRGYHLTHGDHGKIILNRAMHHPNFGQAGWTEKVFDYHWDADWDLDTLHVVLLQWVTHMEAQDEA